MFVKSVVGFIGVLFIAVAFQQQAISGDAVELDELRARIDAQMSEMQFHDAVCSGDLGAVKQFIASGFDPLADSNYDYLWSAVNSDNPDLVRYMLELGFDPNSASEYSGPVLRTAAYIGNPEVVKVLLEYGADVRATGTEGETALHVAASGRNLETIRALIEAGALIDCENDSGDTPLNEAVSLGTAAGAEILLEHGADANHYSSIGHLPLGTAVMSKDVAMAATLIAYGADVTLPVSEEGDDTCIQSAVFFGDIELVRCLIAAGAELEVVDSEGLTPLQDAVFEGRTGVADALLAGGAVYDMFSAAARGDTEQLRTLALAGSVNSAPHANGLRAMHWAARFGQTDALALLVELGAKPDIFCFAGVNNFEAIAAELRNGADINATDAGGLTPLHYAAMNGHLESANFLGINGAELDVAAGWRGTPLEIAIDAGHTAIAKRLIELGAAVDGIKDQYTQPIHHAIEQHNYEVAKYLLDHGADMYIQLGGRNGVSWLPLENALFEHDLKMAQLLLDAGYYVDAVTPDGRSAISSAISDEYLEGVRFLLEHGSNVNQTNYITTLGLPGFATKPIEDAYRQRNQEIINLLLEYGAEQPDETFLRMLRQHEAFDKAHSQRFFE